MVFDLVTLVTDCSHVGIGLKISGFLTAPTANDSIYIGLALPILLPLCYQKR